MTQTHTHTQLQLPEFHQRVCVLRDLGYVDAADDTVTLKGRAACEINSTQVCATVYVRRAVAYSVSNTLLNVLPFAAKVELCIEGKTTRRRWVEKATVIAKFGCCCRPGEQAQGTNFLAVAVG